MARDWGLTTALSGVNNWGAIRDERRRELQLVAVQNAMINEELSQQQQAGAAVDEYLRTVSNIKALEPDMERIRAKNDELVSTIQQGVKGADGNVKKYLLGGGIHALNRYKQNLLDSEEVNTALLNAYNHNRYIADRQAGLTSRPVTWEDENGNPTMGDYSAQFNAYMEGKVKRLNYQGGYKRPNYDAREHFSKFYGNDRYKQQAVNPLDLQTYIFEAAKKEGLNDNDAKEFATREAQTYMQQVQRGGTPFYFKQDDPLVRQERLSRIGFYNAKTAAVKAAEESVNWYNLLLNSNQASQPLIAADNMNAPTAVKTKFGDGTIYNYNLPENFTKEMANGQGYTIDKGQIVNKNAIINNNNFYSATGDKFDFSNLDASNIVSAEPLPYAVDLNVGGKNVIKGMAYKLLINEPGAEKTKVDGEAMEGFFSNKEVYGTKKVRGGTGQGDNALGLFGWDQLYDSNDHSYEVTVVQPLSPSMQTRFAVNKGIGVTSPFQEGQMNKSYGFQNASMLQGAFNPIYNALDEEGIQLE